MEIENESAPAKPGLEPKPHAYTVRGPDGTHFIGMKAAAAWLGVPLGTLRSTVQTALLSPENFIGSKPDSLIYRVMREYPALIHPIRVSSDLLAAAPAV